MPTDPLLVVGIDDWAFRRNHRYGTIVCDLERRRIVTLLPDRETATVRAWLSKHPAINIVSRDRGGGYGEAAAEGSFMKGCATLTCVAFFMAAVGGTAVPRSPADTITPAAAKAA
jgi:hypothetical protein